MRTYRELGYWNGFKFIEIQRFNTRLFLKEFRVGESLYEFFDPEFYEVILNQKSSTYYERPTNEMAKKLHISENFEAMYTERVSLTFGHEPVEYRINCGRLDVKKIFFRSQLIVKKFLSKEV